MICKVCGSMYVASKSGFVCPEGHGKLIPLNKATKLQAQYEKYQRKREAELASLPKARWIDKLKAVDVKEYTHDRYIANGCVYEKKTYPIEKVELLNLNGHKVRMIRDEETEKAILELAEEIKKGREQ